MEMEILRKAMDEAFFARCVWQKEDIECLNGVELLDEDGVYELMNRATGSLEDAMTVTGWEVLQMCADELLRERGLLE